MTRFFLVGCGGMGFWTAVGLLAQGHRVAVCDNDTTEGTGGTRLPDFRPFGWKPMYKVELLRALNPHNDHLTTYMARFEELDESEYANADYIVDTTDADNHARGVIKNAAGDKYIRASYDVVGQRLIVVIARGLGFGREIGGYTNSPSAAHAQAAGGLVASLLTRIAAGEAITLPWKLEVQ